MSPISALYVVVPGAVNENEYSVRIDALLAAMREAWRRLVIEVYSTNLGAVEVVFRGDSWQRANDAKLAAMKHLTENGEEVLNEKPSQRVVRVQSSLPPSEPTEPVADTVLVPDGNPDPEPSPVPPRELEPTGDLGAEAEETPDSLVVMTEDVLLLMADKGAVRPADIARLLQHPDADVEYILARLLTDGLIEGSLESIFTLTEAGAQEAARSTFLGGRKAVVEALLVEAPLSMQQLADRMRCTINVPKKSIRLLLLEGIVEQADFAAPDARGHRRRLFDLTEEGRKIGKGYQPPKSNKVGWGAPTPNRAAMLAYMVSVVPEWSLVRAIAGAAGVNTRAVNQFMQEGMAAGYALRERVEGTQVIAYRYRLTDDGLAAAQAYIALCQTHFQAEVVTYRVVLQRPNAKALALVAALKAMPDVVVVVVDN